MTSRTPPPYLDTLPVGCATRVNILARTVTAHKRDGTDMRIVAEKVNRILGAMHHVEHTFGYAGLNNEDVCIGAMVINLD